MNEYKNMIVSRSLNELTNGNILFNISYSIKDALTINTVIGQRIISMVFSDIPDKQCVTVEDVNNTSTAWARNFYYAAKPINKDTLEIEIKNNLKTSWLKKILRKQTKNYELHEVHIKEINKLHQLVAEIHKNID